VVYRRAVVAWWGTPEGFAEVQKMLGLDEVVAQAPEKRRF